jgi:hypothetical protein
VASHSSYRPAEQKAPSKSGIRPHYDRNSQTFKNRAGWYFFIRKEYVNALFLEKVRLINSAECGFRNKEDSDHLGELRGNHDTSSPWHFLSVLHSAVLHGRDKSGGNDGNPALFCRLWEFSLTSWNKFISLECWISYFSLSQMYSVSPGFFFPNILCIIAREGLCSENMNMWFSESICSPGGRLHHFPAGMFCLIFFFPWNS